MPTITLDLEGDVGAPEDVSHLRSAAGSWYAVVAARQVNSKVHQRRWKFRAERIPAPEKVGPGDRVVEFYWYARRRTRR